MGASKGKSCKGAHWEISRYPGGQSASVKVFPLVKSTADTMNNRRIAFMEAILACINRPHVVRHCGCIQDHLPGSRS